MQFVEFFAIAFLGLATGVSAFNAGRPFVVYNIKRIFAAAVFGILIVLIYRSFAQYQAWIVIAPAKYLLPPYAGWSYFATYVGWKFFAPYLASFLTGILFALLMRAYNARHENQFFYEEEYYFAVLAIFLTGHPGWIFYILSLVLAGVVIVVVRSLVFKNLEKTSFYYLWWPVALFVIIISKWIAAFEFYKILKF